MKKIIAFLATLALISPAFVSAAPYIVTQGGTGTSTLTAGQLLVGNGKNPITGTSSPTVISINTSSTTATSTFAGNAYVKGNLQVDGNFFAPVSLVSSGNATINGILTVTGISKFADGAVGTPSVTFTADTNTGIYRLGNDILSLVTNGADRLTINASGNVGIGTTSPFARLSVAGNSYLGGNVTATGTLSILGTATSTFAGGLTVGINKLIVDGSTGNVGIGTTSPLSKLAVSGGASIGHDYNIASPTDGLIVQGNVGIGTSAPGFKLNVVDSVGNGGWLSMFSNGNSNVYMSHSGGYGMYVDAGPNATAGTFALNVNKQGSSYLYVQGDGNVGIGTTSPFAKLSVMSTAGGSTPLYVIASSTSGLATSTAFMVTATGKIGIGTTNPSQKLEINGGMRLNTATAKPTCDSTVRGTFWFTQSGAGVKDAVEVCAKDAADAYAWRTIY